MTEALTTALAATTLRPPLMEIVEPALNASVAAVLWALKRAANATITWLRR